MNNESYRVNFHTHSTYSDGLSTVTEIVDAMQKNHVQFFALTDHDTVVGVRECLELSKKYNIDCVSGIELSIPLPDSSTQSFHLLCYDFDIEIVEKLIDDLRLKKHRYIESLVKQLNNDGYLFEIKPESDFSSVTDIVYALKNNNYINEVSEGYKLLKTKYPHFTSPKLELKSVIDTIHQANGLTIMAHPFEIFNHSTKIRIDKIYTQALIESFIPLGLDGIEVFYEAYSVDEIDFLEKLAKKHNLIMSVGTDYHNKGNTTVVFRDIHAQKNLLPEILYKRRNNQ